MKNYKCLLIILALNIVAIDTIAQEKELLIKYEFKRSTQSLGGDNNLEIIKSDLPTLNVQVYAFNNINIRETEPRINRAFLPEGGFTPNDTVYNYIKVNYIEAILLEPVIYEYRSGLGMDYKVLLKEPLNIFDWKLEKETKSILGYACTKATCSFRGRNYVAFFTREIPFKAAPWKFHGLPGVILEVYSTDDFCSWIAQSLKIRPHKTEIDLPYYGLEIVDLEQYIDILKKDRLRYIEIYEKNVLNFPDDQTLLNILEEYKMNLPRNIEIFDLK